MIVYDMQSITTTFSDQNTVITNIIILFQSSFKGSSLDWDIESRFVSLILPLGRVANTGMCPQPPQLQSPLL